MVKSINNKNLNQFEYFFHLPEKDNFIPFSIDTDFESISKIVPAMDMNSYTFEQTIPGEYLIPLSNNNIFYSIDIKYTFISAIEQFSKITIPKYCQLVRIILLELNRIASHLYSIATLAYNIEFPKMLEKALVDRDDILSILRSIARIHLLQNFFSIGGLQKDIPVGFVEKIIGFTKNIYPKIQYYKNLLLKNLLLIERTANIGILSQKRISKLQIGGLIARAAGIMEDCRKNSPDSPYSGFDFKIPIGIGRKGTAGDSWNRYWIRCREMEESVKIINQGIEELLYSPKSFKFSSELNLPQGKYKFISEGSCARCFCTVSNNTENNIFSLQLTSPEKILLDKISHIAKHTQLSDLPVFLSSLGLKLYNRK